MPSIQLATLAAALEQAGIGSRRFEFYIDYAAMIGSNVYNLISDLPGFTPEWIFARHYFGEHRDHEIGLFLEKREEIGLFSREREDQVLEALRPVTEEFLRRALDQLDLAQLDVVGFSLTISQVSSSLALAQLIKAKNPQTFIVFGGAGCAGPMGAALMRMSSHVDAVVRTEGEPALPELVRCVRNGSSLEHIDGLCWRDATGVIKENANGPLYVERAKRPFLNYDSYFDRLKQVGLQGRMNVWLPFESSRGCWYGQKRQCTFCGLHEIMNYRSWGADDVMNELEHLEARHGLSNFFAVDLILPRDFLTDFFPEVLRRGHDWSFFYEVKANLKRQEVAMLASAGVRRIQPGIESLDDDLLRLMEKGVSMLQNVQLLKWCEEFGIRAAWNLITRIPGERPDAYRRIIELMPRLHHLRPPHGAGDVQLHRFSPYFEQPEKYGIHNRRPHFRFKYIFPVEADVLEDLVYIHECDFTSSLVSDDLISDLRREVGVWKEAYRSGSRLSLHDVPGGMVIEDKRTPHRPRTHRLGLAEAAVYRLLDQTRTESMLGGEFRKAHHGSELPADIDAIIQRWVDDGLVLRDRNRLLALAVAARDERARPERASESAPLPCLE